MNFLICSEICFWQEDDIFDDDIFECFKTWMHGQRDSIEKSRTNRVCGDDGSSRKTFLESQSLGNQELNLGYELDLER